MVLQKQIITLPFNGVQTKVDPKMAPLGSYAVIDNMIMNRTPELVKRDALTLIGQTTTPSNINACYSYLNEMGVITDKSLYAYASSNDQWVLKGLTAAPVITAKPIIANTYTQTNCDGAQTASGILGIVWEDSRGGIRCSIKDTATDTFLQTDIQLHATGVKPQVHIGGEHIVFTYIVPSTTTLYTHQYDVPRNAFETPSAITTICASSYTYDAATVLDHVMIVVAETTAAPAVIKGYYWNVNTKSIGNGTNGLEVPTSLAFTNSGATPPCISIVASPDEAHFACLVYNNNKEVYVKAFSLQFVPIYTELQVSSATTDAGWQLTGMIDEDTDILYIYYTSKGTLQNTFKATVSEYSSASAAVTSNAAFYLQMGIVSKAWMYNNNACVILGYSSTLQSTLFGVRDDGACFGRFFTTQAGLPTKANSSATVSLVTSQSNTYIIPMLKTTKILSSGADYFTTTSVFTEQIYFTPQNIDNKVLGKYLNIAGGYLKQYDGSNTVFEQGFHLYPEAPTSVSSNGAGTIPNGTYSYVTCWEWTDNQGQIHRSQPSTPLTVTLSGSDDTITLTQRCLPITNKQTRFSDLRTNVVLAVYRTASLGTTYYRLNPSVSTFVYNDPTAQTISYVDGATDATITANATLYTTGGVYSNICPPSANLLAVGKNRVFLAGIDTEPNKVFFSKEKEEGLGVEFSEELSFIVDSLGGDITALAAMDDKVLIFKKSLVYYVAGQGPDKLGNGSFTIPMLVSADTGCNRPQSVVLTGEGIMFQSQKGIYMISRQLEVTYIGAPLDNITTRRPTFTVSSATNLPDQNQVFFTTNDSQSLVYDTYFKNWYTHTYNFAPVSGTLLNNYWYPTSTSEVYKSSTTIKYDNGGQSIISRLKTNWINLNGFAGFGRIYAILLLGDNAAVAHTLKCNLYYDFKDFAQETVSITPTSLAGSAFGDDATFGASDVYGGQFDGTYNFVVRPMIQKCSSIMIEILDDFPTGARTESFKFSGIALVVGMKQGYNKNLSPSRRMT